MKSYWRNNINWKDVYEISLWPSLFLIGQLLKYYWRVLNCDFEQISNN